MDEVSTTRMLAEAKIRSVMASEKLKQEGWYDRHPDIRIDGPITVYGDEVYDAVETAHALADRMGVPQINITEAIDEANAVPSDSNPRLSRIGETWLRHKCEASGRRYVDAGERKKLERSPLTKHERDTLANWTRFVNCLGDLRLAELGPEHFRKFYAWASREAAKRSGCWHRDVLGSVKMVFGHGQRHYPDWKWPAGITERLKAYTAKRYKPAESNAEPMPPSIFRALLDRCDAWAAIDSEQFDRSTQSGRAKRLQAARKRRQGVQMRMVLQLAANCGLNATDVERMSWTNLNLSTDGPYLDMPREKVRHTAGRAVDRRTPLIPAVADAIRRWQSTQPPSSPDGLVFITDQGTPLTSVTVSRAARLLLQEAGHDTTFSFKHLRNIGPTLAAAAGVGDDRIARFLGHELRLTSRYYRGRQPVDFVKPIIDLIEKHYFGQP